MAPDELSYDRGRIQNRASAHVQTSRQIPLQHSRWSFQRPVAPAAGITVKVDTPADEPPSKVEKRQSKMSLFSLFAPPKVERSRGYTEAGLEAISERQPAAHVSVTSRKTSRPPSSMSVLRVDEPEIRQPLASSASSIRTTASLAGWDAPPLFQAYPQAIKYATLQASTVSTEMLQRAQGHERRLSHLQEQFEGTGNLTLDTEDMAGVHTPKKPARATLSKKRYSNAQSRVAPLASKVYVLVTSGYLLQYSGEGSANRMPEKVLPLDKESVAFASDLIPGKHFVLEVQQKPQENANALAVPQQQSRSLLKRLRSQPQAVKKSTNTMLLILDGADEMISWMKAVRRVIDDKNGRGHTPSPSPESKRDSGHSVDDAPKQLPSHRYRVQRSANPYDSTKSNASASVMSRAASTGPLTGLGAPPGEAGREEEAVRTLASSRSRVRPSEEGTAPSTTPAPRASVRQSVEAPSFATTASASSQDQIRLDKLRDSRHSFLSNRTSATGNATLTSSSSPPSPAEEHLTANPVKRDPTPRSSYIAVNPPIIPQRRSFQRLPATAELPNAGLPDAPLPLATLRSSTSESNLFSSVRSPAEKNLRRLSSQTTTVPLRMRMSSGPIYRSQSALEYRRPTDQRASTISAVSEVGTVVTSPVIDDQQTELEAATDAAAEIASMMEPDSQRLTALGALPNLSNPSLLSLHRQQQAQDKDRIPASVRQKYRSSTTPQPPAGQAAAVEMQSLMNSEPFTTHQNVSSHSLSSLHHRQQAQDKERIPASLREKYQARRRERAPPAQNHVRSPEEEAAAVQMQSIMDPDARRVSAAEAATDAVQLPLELQYKQQQEQDKNRVPTNVRQKFQNASTGRASEPAEQIDQETAAAQIQSILDPEDRVSSRLDTPGKLPSQSLQAMYKTQQNQDKNRIPAELRNKYKAAADARHSRQPEDIDSSAAAAQIQAIMDPSARPVSSVPAKPAFQSIHSMHKNQLSQDKERIPAATRKKYQRPIPIRVSQPGQNVDRPLPKAAPAAEQPIIPKRFSSLPSPAPKSPAGPGVTPSGQPPSPSIAHFPQPPQRTSATHLPPIVDEASVQQSGTAAPAPSLAGSNNNSPTLTTTFNQASSVDAFSPQGLRRPVSLQVRATAAPFLSSRPQPNSGARRSFTAMNNSAPVRPASAQALGRSGRASSPGPAMAFSGLQTVGEARTLRAMGPSDPRKQASERLALRSGMKRASSPIGVKVRVSMPTIGINGPPVRIEPMLPMSISLDSLPASPGPPPSCALPAVPGPPPVRALPTIPGSARTSLRSTPTPTQTVVG